MIDRRSNVTHKSAVDLPLSPSPTDMSQAADTMSPTSVLLDSEFDMECGRIDRRLNVTQASDVDLAKLHREMDHLARSYWDLQKARQAIQNRAERLAREAGILSLALALDHGNRSQEGLPLDALAYALEKEEERLERELAKLAKQHPLASWVAVTRGVGLPGFARLMGLTGRLDRFSNPAKLWKFVGLGLVNGRTQHRRKGELWTHTNCDHAHLKGVKKNGEPICKPDCTIDHHPDCRPGVEGTAYSPDARVMVFQMIDSTIRLRGTYRPVYDEAKARYEARERLGPSACPTGLHHRSASGRTVRCPKAHIDMLARRYAAKRLLRDMWREWHQTGAVTQGPDVSLAPQNTPEIGKVERVAYALA